MSVIRYDLTEDVNTGVVDVTAVPERMEGRFVRWEDHAELKAQRDALAAENAALKLPGYVDDLHGVGPVMSAEAVEEAIRAAGGQVEGE